MLSRAFAAFGKITTPRILSPEIRGRFIAGKSPLEN